MSAAVGFGQLSCKWNIPNTDLKLLACVSTAAFVPSCDMGCPSHSSLYSHDLTFLESSRISLCSSHPWALALCQEAAVTWALSPPRHCTVVDFGQPDRLAVTQTLWNIEHAGEQPCANFPQVTLTGLWSHTDLVFPLAVGWSAKGFSHPATSSVLCSVGLSWHGRETFLNTLQYHSRAASHLKLSSRPISQSCIAKYP